MLTPLALLSCYFEKIFLLKIKLKLTFEICDMIFNPPGILRHSTWHVTSHHVTLNLSQTLLAILRSKEGDDNWVTGRGTEETKDGLRRKVKDAEAVIADLEHTITMVKQDMIDRRSVCCLI
jgi:hypothetical protein